MRARIGAWFESFATKVTRFAGSSWASGGAFGVVLVWGALGPLVGFSDTWQLTINTGTTIVTFLMVFLIQRSQNKDSLAIHLKLNELIASSRSASNRLVDVEDLSEQELHTLRRFYEALSEMAKHAKDLRSSHSIDEAQARHAEKARPG
ncbi:MAG: low affinity iron permease family protein [Myxococcota bacterium]